MVDRYISFEFILAALILTVSIFGGIFYASQLLSEEKVSRVEHSIERFNVEQNSQELSRRLAGNLNGRNCEALNIAVRQTGEEIRDLQQRVADYEQSSKLEQEEFTLLKKRYMNLLLEYWLTTKEVERQCGSDVTKVLYLYTDDCELCPDQGTLLTYYLQVYGDRLIVFPLDASIGSRPVQMLEDAYGIERYPSLVIDGEVHEGFHDRDELGELLDTYINSTEGNLTGES